MYSEGFTIFCKEVKKNGFKCTIKKSFYLIYKLLFIFNKDQSHNIFHSMGYDYKENFDPQEIEAEINNFAKKPLISIIMPVYNVDVKWLKLALDSIYKQFYGNWELVIVDDASTNKKTIDFLKGMHNKKIIIKFLNKNIHISGASNEAFKLINGEYVALMDHDDELTKDALFEVVKKINKENPDFIYSDEDKIDVSGKFSDPNIKSQYIENQFLTTNYLSHLAVIKRIYIEKVNGWEIGLEGAQDYDLYLKIFEYTDKIAHIPKVLYHWRTLPFSTATNSETKSYAHNAGKKALQNALSRRNINGEVKDGRSSGIYEINLEA